MVRPLKEEPDFSDCQICSPDVLKLKGSFVDLMQKSSSFIGGKGNNTSHLICVCYICYFNNTLSGRPDDTLMMISEIKKTNTNLDPRLIVRG